MCNKVYTLDEIRSIAAPIAKDYGVDALYLFGSYARGDATPESDMDFRIDKGSVCSVFKLLSEKISWRKNNETHCILCTLCRSCSCYAPFHRLQRQ